MLEKEGFQKQMLEKLIWICAFMLVGARHPGATVGAVEKEYRSEVENEHSLVQEETRMVYGNQKVIMNFAGVGPYRRTGCSCSCGERFSL